MAPGKMEAIKAKLKRGGHEQQMPEMMLTMMMPHCIGMMLPAIEPDKRGEAASAILSAIVEKGSIGMSDQQAMAFRKVLGEVLNPSG